VKVDKKVSEQQRKIKNTTNNKLLKIIQSFFSQTQAALNIACLTAEKENYRTIVRKVCHLFKEKASNFVGGDERPCRIVPFLALMTGACYSTLRINLIYREDTLSLDLSSLSDSC